MKSPQKNGDARAARREAVIHLCMAHEVSQRRACTATGIDRSSVRYRIRRPDDMFGLLFMEPP